MSLIFNNRLLIVQCNDSIQVAPSTASAAAETQKRIRSAEMLFTRNIWIKISNYLRRTQAIMKGGG